MCDFLGGDGELYILPEVYVSKDLWPLFIKKKNCCSYQRHRSTRWVKLGPNYKGLIYFPEFGLYLFSFVFSEQRSRKSKEHNKKIPLFLDESIKVMQWRKDSLFSKECWDNWIFTCASSPPPQNMYPHLTPYTKIN